ncbi:hypothetical protein RJT34_32782 [Clitoria ternatea]|uniref:Serine-rich protein-like protein n=1 Tax=Clitoria ternatea TaxID=43366 RepID=A0AAN9I9U6_CLITE
MKEILKKREGFAEPNSRTRLLEKLKYPFSFFSQMAVASRKSRTQVLRSLSPSPRFCNSHSHSSSAFASSTSSFASRSTTFFHRPTSPTRVNLCGSSSSASSVRFALDRSVSPNRSISVTPRTTASRQTNPHHQKRTCMCSPTTHPGSFRCSLHKKNFGSHALAAPYSPNRLNARRSAMTNSLVRIRGVEGDLVKRALAALIRPSSHQQRRRGDFHPRPSRLSVMSKAQDS